MLFVIFVIFLKTLGIENELSNFAKASELYEYNSNFYLILSDIDVNSKKLNFICSSITEFAHFVNSSELFESKIKEYGKLVIKENALSTCMEYFT